MTIGILGGMGPRATADFYRRLIEATPSKIDQGHLPVLIDADPRIPDRTEALRDPVLGSQLEVSLLAAARRLVAGGAQLLVCPCNSATPFVRRLPPDLNVVDWISSACAELVRTRPGTKTLRIVGTRGTDRAGLYRDALAAHGISTLPLTEDEQSMTDEAIAAAKAGDRPPPSFVGWLTVQRIPPLIACTDLSEALDGDGFPDASELVAANLVRLAMVRNA